MRLSESQASIRPWVLLVSVFIFLLLLFFINCVRPKPVSRLSLFCSKLTKNMQLFLATVQLVIFITKHICGLKNCFILFSSSAKMSVINQFNFLLMVSLLIPRSHYRAITTIALIVSDRDIQAKIKI